MTDESHATRTLVDVEAWLDAASRDVLDLIVASVSEMAEFQVAAISVVRDDQMITVSAEGADGVAETLLGVSAPLDAVEREVAVGDDWGRFSYVPHDRALNELSDWTWTPDTVRGEWPDAWDPLDLCMAPLHGADGALIGLLSIDLPLSGRQPSPAHRVLLDRYAAQAERAVAFALERIDMAERIRLSETARQVVRLATSQTELERVLDDCRAPIVEGYRTDFLAIRTYESDDIPALGTGALEASPEIRALVRTIAERCWDGQRTVALIEAAPDPTVSATEHTTLVEFMATVGLGAVMLVPLGAGTSCLGVMVFGRKDPGFVWNADERSGALDIARDIGQAVMASLTRARERRLVAELRRLSTYKSELLSTVSHELKNPLGVIAGHLELLDGGPDLTAESQFSVSAMGRATRRVKRVVDDLLLLSRVEDPEAPVDSRPVKLGPLVEDALEMVRFAAQQRNLELTVELPTEPLFGCGDPEELDRVLTNLLSNAVKYTPRDKAIKIAVVDHGSEVEVAVTDEGIGISEADQALLFTEFYRSSNPRALAQPGTGLGLAICARIVARHQGRIEVESELGVGSTFRVFLPAPCDED